MRPGREGQSLALGFTTFPRSDDAILALKSRSFEGTRTLLSSSISAARSGSWAACSSAARRSPAQTLQTPTTTAS